MRTARSLTIGASITGHQMSAPGGAQVSKFGEIFSLGYPVLPVGVGLGGLCMGNGHMGTPTPMLTSGVYWLGLMRNGHMGPPPPA